MSKIWTVGEYPPGAAVRFVSIFCKGVRVATIADAHLDRKSYREVPRKAQYRYADQIADTMNACEGINPEAVGELLEAARWAIDSMFGYEQPGIRTAARKLGAAIAKAEGKD
jgi:hypothetical protein